MPHVLDLFHSIEMPRLNNHLRFLSIMPHVLDLFHSIEIPRLNTCSKISFQCPMFLTCFILLNFQGPIHVIRSMSFQCPWNLRAVQNDGCLDQHRSLTKLIKLKTATFSIELTTFCWWLIR